VSGAEDTLELAEETRMYLRRYAEARRFGFCKVDARLWAESQVDSGELRRLMGLGCAPRLAAKILRT
jgi:hypothetical protein